MKKKIVEVDEDVLKDIIVGDIPVFGKDSPAPFGYRERFLVNIPASNRSHVYINREVAECIKRVLPVIAPEMSISGFISNILGRNQRIV